MSRIINFIQYTKSNKIPLSQDVNDRIFKIIFLDIGLINHILKIRLDDFDNLITANEGTLAEQFIGQQLLTLSPFFMENELYYWIREKRNAEAEIDYLTEVNNSIIPIEVKSGKSGTLKFLQIYISEKKKKTGIRFNINLPSITNVNTQVKLNNKMRKINFKLISLPLYLVAEYKRLVEND